MRRTSTPIVCSRCASASATPDLVGHEDHSPTGTERDTGWLANSKWRTQVGNRYAAWNAIGGVETGGSSDAQWQSASKREDADTAGFFCAGSGFSCTAEGLAAGSLATPGCRSRANLITWAKVGNSRSLRFSSRGMLYAARTAANISACLTVSMPRSASRSRSRSNISLG